MYTPENRSEHLKLLELRKILTKRKGLECLDKTPPEARVDSCLERNKSVIRVRFLLYTIALFPLNLYFIDVQGGDA